MNRRETLYSRFPPAPAFNYELDPERGYFSVILPEATTNLVTNPSVEIDLTGYTQHGGATLAQVFTWQAYGAAGISVTPALSAESGLYFGTVSLTAGTTYTASITIQGEEGRKYFIWFATTAGALIGSKRTWIGTGRKQRIHVTYTETSSTTRRVYITRDAYADQHVWYADGLQVEAKTYPTTYCDGDQKGFVINQAAYLWTGTPHVSTSTRSAQTRAGGREVSLLSLGFRILSIIGLGMAPLVDQSLAIPGQGELYQGTGTTAREFSLIGSIFGDGPGPRHLQSIRDDLIDAFKPDLTSVQQPLLLRYQALDEIGDPCSDTLDLVCTYQGALEGNWNNHQREDLALQFKMYLPIITNQYTSGTSLSYSAVLANSNYLLRRDPNGVWAPLATALNNTVTSIVKDNNGNLYVGGLFTNVGDANGDYIIKIAPDGTISSLGTGMNDIVFALAVAPNGNLYAGGRFTLAGGIAGTARIARWDGAAWNAVGGGIASGDVNTLVFDTLGNLFIGGSFTNHFDANGDRITKWDGAAYSSLGLGMNNDVNILAFDMGGNLYAGGAFTLAGGVANTVYIAKWTGTAWQPLGTGMDGIVRALAIGLDGSVYVGGNFSLASGSAFNRVARWNGTTWTALGLGMDEVGAVIYAMDVDPFGNIYTVGTFTQAGGITVPKDMAVWTGSVWIPMDLVLPAGAVDTFTVWIDTAGNVYIGYTNSGNATSSVITSVTVNGSSVAYPKIVMTGPGNITEIKNFTTGKAIYFDLTLLAGEKAYLDLNPENITFVSSFRGNLLSTILPGSNLDFSLLPGSNNLSLLMPSGTTAATAVTITWKDSYWSLDGAAVK